MTNPVETAVAPLKNDAMDRAEKEARKIVDRIITKLAECGNDLSVAAPYPSSSMRREDYRRFRSIHIMYGSVVKHRSSNRSFRDPDYVDVCPERVQRFIDNAKKDAAAQYDSFVAKLTTKVGPVVSAELSGNHVWGRSTLTVVTIEGQTVRWMTQMIVNVSKLGTLFNQWPTRKVK